LRTSSEFRKSKPFPGCSENLYNYAFSGVLESQASAQFILPGKVELAAGDWFFRDLRFCI
jgi:hypothetical protein